MVEKSDYFTWMYNKSGQLTVKSAYWLASTVKAEKNLLEVFMLPSLSALKEKVWKVQTVSKIRIFLSKSMRMLSQRLT